MATPKVSVIIPVYGVENYIERCARSLFEQTLQEIEYIFVDDCTKDNSIQVLERVIEDYPNRKNNIKILHHEKNQGLPIARQTGLKIACGEYIAHCDSDDWVDKDIYRQLYEKAKREDLDICFCDYFQSDGNGNDTAIINKDKNLDKEYLIQQSTKSKIHTNVWRMIVKNEIYHNPNIVYSKNNMLEDRPVLIQCLSYSNNKIGWINKPLYYYFYNTTSICGIRTTESTLKKYNDVLANNKIIIDFLQQTNIKHKEDCIINQKLYARKIIERLTAEKEHYNLWKNTYPEIKGKVVFNKNIPTPVRLRYILTSLRLNIVVFRIKQKALKSKKFNKYAQKLDNWR